MDKNIAENIKAMTDRANAMMTEYRIQFDTLVTMQHDERIEMQKIHQEEKDKMRKHYGRIIMGLILALVILLGGIVCGAVYLFSNYDFTTYGQEAFIGGDGTNNINDGIHYSTTQ